MSQQTVWVVMRTYDDESGLCPYLLLICASHEIAHAAALTVVGSDREMPREILTYDNRESADLYDGYGRLIIYPVDLIGEQGG